VDDKQPDGTRRYAVTSADVAEAVARGGLALGEWGTLGFGKDGLVVDTHDTTPVRSEIERGRIGWVDTYLESDSAFASPIDPRMLRPAGPQPTLNRADRRKNRRRRR
jgi:hypothetical protein